MAEIRGKNQPTAVPLLLLTGHRPPTRQGLLPSLFGGYSGTPGETETGDRLRIHAIGISEAPALAREGEWEGKPIRPHQPRPSLGRGGCRQYLYSGRRGLNPPSVQLWVNQSCA